MLNIKFKKIAVLTCILLLQPMLNPGSQAWAKKKKPPKAFSFFVEGGKASQGECDGEREIPRKLKHLKEFSKSGSYMGSELQTPDIKAKDNAEMWKHFFRAKESCNTVLAKTPSMIKEETLKAMKSELPPDDSADSDDDSDRSSDTPDPE